MLRRVSLAAVAAGFLLSGFGCLGHRCGDRGGFLMSRTRGDVPCLTAGSGPGCVEGVPVGPFGGVPGGPMLPGAVPDASPPYMLPQPTPGPGSLLPPQGVPSTPFAPPSVAPAPGPEAMNVLPAPTTPGMPVKNGK